MKITEVHDLPKKKRKTIYYIENCVKGLDLEAIKKENQEKLSWSLEQLIGDIIKNSGNMIDSNIYYAQEDQGPAYGFRLNYNYLFIFNRHKIIYMDINKPFHSNNI